MADFDLGGSNRESSVEDAVVAWAENNGWFARFMAYRGRRGCRDVDFYGYSSIVMMEFKKTGGGELSGNQINERARMSKAGLIVHVVDSAEQGISILRGQMETFDLLDM
jgi:hypothetical protein